jgi:hypothetical protein
MRKVKINGIDCLLFEGDEKAGINPFYPHEYYIRHADDDWDLPATIEKFVAVNKFGFIQAKEPIPMATYGHPEGQYDEYAEITSFIDDENGEERIGAGSEDASLCSCEFCGKELKDGDSAYGLTTGSVRSDIEGFGNDETPWVYIACPECQSKTDNLLFSIRSYLEKEIKELAEHLKDKAKEYDSSNDGSFDAISQTLWEQSGISDLSHISKRCGEIQALFGVAQKFGIELSSEVQKLEEWGDVINPAS